MYVPPMGYGGGWSTAPRYAPQYVNGNDSQGEVITFGCFVVFNDSVSQVSMVPITINPIPLTLHLHQY